MLSAPDFKEKQILFAFLNQGEKLSFKNDNIVIRDRDNVIKHQSTCYRLFAIFVAGHVSITSGLLQRAQRFGFSIILMTYTCRVYGTWSSRAEGNLLLRKKQYAYRGWDIARHIVANKINSQISALKSIRNKDEELKSAITLLKSYILDLNNQDLDLKEILGIEGVAAKVYFKNLFSDYGWTARRPRVKHDMTNCLMDIGYTMLFNFIEALLNVYGFDLYNGVYHREFYQRKSLVCDIIEPFRPIIDKRIRNGFNLGQCNEEDFHIDQGQYRLFGKKAVPYIGWLMEPIIDHKQGIFKYIRDYYRAFMKNKDIKDYPVFNASI